MYAVIELGGKQQIVKEGDKILVEKQNAQEGKEITIEKVLLVAKDDKIHIGQPYVKNAVVSALVLKQTLGEKVSSFKYRKRKASHTTKGHRQQLTQLEIKKIKA